MRARSAVVLGSVLALSAAAAQAQIYRWTDEQGRTHLTDTPPPASARDVQKRSGEAPGVAAQTPYELARAMNAIDESLPAFAAAQAVLESRYPEVARYLFNDHEAARSAESTAGVARVLERLVALHEGNAPSVDPESGRGALELLAARKILDLAREEELREFIATARRGATPAVAAHRARLEPIRARAAADFSIASST